MDKNTFGTFLRNYRETIGYGLRDFASRIGLSPTALSAVELGQRDIPANLDLYKVAELLGIQKGSKDWNLLFDLAANKDVPSDVRSLFDDKELSSSVVGLLRTVNKVRPSATTLEKLQQFLIDSSK